MAVVLGGAALETTILGLLCSVTGMMEGLGSVGSGLTLVGGGCCGTVCDIGLTLGTGCGCGLVGGVGFRPGSCCWELLVSRSDVSAIDTAGRSLGHWEDSLGEGNMWRNRSRYELHSKREGGKGRIVHHVYS